MSGQWMSIYRRVKNDPLDDKMSICLIINKHPD